MSTPPTHKLLLGLTLSTVVPALVFALYADAWWVLAIPVIMAVGLVGWHHPRALLGLLFISLPLSIEFSFSDRLGTDLPDEPLMLAMTMLSIAYLTFKGRPFSSSIWRHPLFICFSIWLSWMAVTSILSTSPLLSGKFLLAKSWYTGAFVFAPLIWLRDSTSIGNSLRYLFIPLFLLAILSLVRHAMEGFSFVTASTVVQPYFRNHVVYSAMLVTLLPVLFFSRPFLTWKKTWICAMGLMLLALFFSYARGAWLALLVGALAYLLLRSRLLVYSYIAVLLIGLLALIWLKQDDRYLRFAPDYRTTIFHSEFQDHWRATYEGKDVSTVERFYRWIAGVRMVEQRPWTGFGPASFYQSYRPYTVPAYKTWVSENPDRSTVHNYFLLTAAEQGIPGLFIFLLLFGAILYYAECIYHRGSNKLDRSIAAGIGMGMVMLGVVNFWSDLIETDKIGSLFFLSVSFLLILDRNRSVGPNIESVT